MKKCKYNFNVDLITIVKLFIVQFSSIREIRLTTNQRNRNRGNAIFFVIMLVYERFVRLKGVRQDAPFVGTRAPGNKKGVIRNRNN